MGRREISCFFTTPAAQRKKEELTGYDPEPLMSVSSLQIAKIVPTFGYQRYKGRSPFPFILQEGKLI